MRAENNLHEAYRYSTVEEQQRAMALALIDIAWTLRDILDELHNNGNGFTVKWPRS